MISQELGGPTPGVLELLSHGYALGSYVHQHDPIYGPTRVKDSAQRNRACRLLPGVVENRHGGLRSRSMLRPACKTCECYVTKLVSLQQMHISSSVTYS